jgi:hypothetical protein
VVPVVLLGLLAALIIGDPGRIDRQKPWPRVTTTPSVVAFTEARSRMAVRNVPIPPEMVDLLREHMDRFGTADDGRLFRTETALRSSRPRTGRSG